MGNRPLTRCKIGPRLHVGLLLNTNRKSYKGLLFNIYLNISLSKRCDQIKEIRPGKKRIDDIQKDCSEMGLIRVSHAQVSITFLVPDFGSVVVKDKDFLRGQQHCKHRVSNKCPGLLEIHSCQSASHTLVTS